MFAPINQTSASTPTTPPSIRRQKATATNALQPQVQSVIGEVASPNAHSCQLCCVRPIITMPNMVWARQRILQQLLLMWLAFTVISAPLLCIWYCQIRHTVMSDMASAEMTMLMHSVDMATMSQSELSPTHFPATQSPAQPQPHRPIDDMSQIMLTVTECIIALALLAIVLIRMGDVALIAPVAVRVHARRQTPPPRFA